MASFLPHDEERVSVRYGDDSGKDVGSGDLQRLRIEKRPVSRQSCRANAEGVGPGEEDVRAARCH
jgi:hypothetical protein